MDTENFAVKRWLFFCAPILYQNVVKILTTAQSFNFYDMYQCSLCLVLIGKVHELTHTDNKRHACPTCGKKYSDVRCFQRHVASHDQAAVAPSTPTSYQCGICQTVFENMQSLRSHNRLQHRHTVQVPAVDRNYFCGQCGKQLTVQTSNQQEIILSANCSCSAEVDVDGTTDDVIGSDKLDDVIHGAVNVTHLDNTTVKVQLPDELLDA